MHRVATTAGDWNPQSSDIVFIEQDPAPIVLLTAADTDIQAIASAWGRLPVGFPAVRVANILGLGLQIAIDAYAETVLERAQVIVIRLIGGIGYWPYGIEVVEEVVGRTGAQLIILPGDDRPDLALFDRSTLPLTELDRLWRYFIEGGVENIQQALYFIAERCLGLDYPSALPAPVPKVFEYRSHARNSSADRDRSRVGMIFYRAHYLAGNTKPVDLLCESLVARGLEPVAIAVSSLRDPEVQAELIEILQPKAGRAASVLLNTTSFSLIDPAPISPVAAVVADETQLWRQLDIPIIQVILSGGGEADWLTQLRGLSPRDTAMNVALPEVDGRIISRAISFKAVQSRHPDLQTEVLGYQPRRDRVEFVECGGGATGGVDFS
jgi:cobaltochelatase CobN